MKGGAVVADTDWTHDPGNPNQTDEEATGVGFEETSDEALDAEFDAAGADIAANSAEADAEAEAAEEAELSQADADAAKIAELTSDLQRVSAEFANYRRRVDRDRESDRAAAKAKFVSDLLALADDLDRAEQHATWRKAPRCGHSRTSSAGSWHPRAPSPSAPRVRSSTRTCTRPSRTSRRATTRLSQPCCARVTRSATE